MIRHVLFVLLIFILSCTKVGKNVTVTGRVLNPITGEGIPNVQLKLLKGTIGLPGGFKSIKETLTDENGYFEINKMTLSKVILQASNTGDEPHYRIGWWLDTGYFSLASPYEIPVKKGKKMEADYHMVPYGNFILNINNINCQGPTDTMFFRHKLLGYTEFENNYSTPRVGCYSYFSPMVEVPMGTHVYETKVIRSGIVSFLYDTVFVPETGSATLNIDY